jgi:hypothetical protein
MECGRLPLIIAVLEGKSMIDAGVILLKVIRPFAICGGLWMTYKMAQYLASGNKSATRQLWTWVGVVTVFPIVPWLWMFSAQDAHPIASEIYEQNLIATCCVVVIAALYGLSDGHKEWKESRRDLTSAFHPTTWEDAIDYFKRKREREELDREK